MLEFRLRLEFVPGVRINDIPAVGEIMASLSNQFHFLWEAFRHIGVYMQKHWSDSRIKLSQTLFSTIEMGHRGTYIFLDNCRGTKINWVFIRTGDDRIWRRIKSSLPHKALAKHFAIHRFTKQLINETQIAIPCYGMVLWQPLWHKKVV